MSDVPNALDSIRRLMRRRSSDSEQCELCSAPVPIEHAHLVEITSRKILCACQACAILFSGRDDAKYRRIPDRIEMLSDFVMTDAQWESLNVPISLAFFFYDSNAGRVVAFYPSPAGATESLLPLDAWQQLIGANPVLAELQPDVEAMLAKRIGGQNEYFRVPIDQCYKLVGLIRMHWRGLSGGTEVWREIGKFYDQLKTGSVTRTAVHA